MKNQPDSLTEKPLATLPFSPEFLKMAEANKFETLEDVLKTPMHKFPELPQSGYRMVRELINFMNANALGHRIKS